MIKLNFFPSTNFFEILIKYLTLWIIFCLWTIFVLWRTITYHKNNQTILVFAWNWRQIFSHFFMKVRTQKADKTSLTPFLSLILIHNINMFQFFTKLQTGESENNNSSEKMCFFRRYFLSIYGAIPKPRAYTVQLLLTVECLKTLKQKWNTIWLKYEQE
jgi:hypothetical protein